MHIQAANTRIPICSFIMHIQAAVHAYPSVAFSCTCRQQVHTYPFSSFLMHIQAASTHIHISIFLMHIQLQTTNWVSRTTTAAAATARQTDHAQNSCIHCSKEALWNSFIHVRSKTRSSPAEKKLRRPICPLSKKNKTKPPKTQNTKKETAFNS